VRVRVYVRACVSVCVCACVCLSEQAMSQFRWSSYYIACIIRIPLSP